MQDAFVRELRAKFCEVWTIKELVTKKIKSNVNSVIFRSFTNIRNFSFLPRGSRISKLHKKLYEVHTLKHLAPQKKREILNFFSISNQGTVHAQAHLSPGNKSGHSYIFQRVDLLILLCISLYWNPQKVLYLRN